jgi:hypothetical protein
VSLSFSTSAHQIRATDLHRDWLLKGPSVTKKLHDITSVACSRELQVLQRCFVLTT